MGLRAGSACPDGNFWRKSSHTIIPHYWNPQQVERLLDALAALGLRRARVAALIMWRPGLRVGETVALEWRDIDVTSGSLLVRRGKGGRGRTVPLHPDLASLFANWPSAYGPRDLVVGLTRKTALRHLRVGIKHADLDEESPGTGRQRAGAHSLRHSAARHWLTTAGILGRPLTRGAYSASKGAVRTFTKTAAIQHATENIRCNSIHPGPVDTPMLANISDNPEVLRQRTDEVPLGRLGVSRDIAYGALYLASHEATRVTGIELIIDGGITAK